MATSWFEGKTCYFQAIILLKSISWFAAGENEDPTPNHGMPTDPVKSPCKHHVLSII